MSLRWNEMDANELLSYTTLLHVSHAYQKYHLSLGNDETFVSITIWQAVLCIVYLISNC